jgi:hypothetical protein
MTNINLIVHNPEEFRAALPESGLFEMFDCAMWMEVPTDAPVQDIEQMTLTLQSFINVTDIEVTTVDDGLNQYYISIVETPFTKRKSKS